MPDVSASLEHVSATIDQAWREVNELLYDPISWGAISRANQLSDVLNLTQYLKAASAHALRIGAVIAGRPVPLVRAAGEKEDDSDG
jgi:hypothetical protein